MLHRGSGQNEVLAHLSQCNAFMYVTEGFRVT